jgi:Flp pilus assembly protein TadG
MIGALGFCSRLARSTSGVAMTEFALSLPLLLTAGLWGTESANLAITHMQISQLAIQIADNGARIGDTSTLENRKIYESDINDLLVGAKVQASGLKFFDRGRAIISSLEVDTATSRQYIHWQRCKGLKNVTSSYGVAGDGLSGATITGIGPAGTQVAAPAGGAVIFVELVYEYRPLVSAKFVGTDPIKATAAFVVRDSRDLSQIYQRSTTSPDPVASCATFSTYT